MGAAGLAGVIGPAGATGPAGAAGTPGLAGAAGPTGAIGAAGATGAGGAAGAAGATGATGTPGLAGAGGITGPSGPSGATGPGGGLSAYAGASHIVLVSDSFVTSGSDIPFNTNGAISGITHSAGSSTFTVSTAGRYEIVFSANITDGLNSALAVAVNGSVVSGSSVPLLTSSGTLSGRVVLILDAGDSVGLRNEGQCDMSLAISPLVGAQVTVKLLMAGGVG